MLSILFYNRNTTLTASTFFKYTGYSDIKLVMREHQKSLRTEPEQDFRE